jgi:hypothetical protein
MPWTPAQHRLFEAAAHNASIAKKRGIPQETASRMAGEGIKKPMNPVMHTHYTAEAEVKEGKGSDYDHLRRDERPGERGKSLREGKKPIAKERSPFSAGRKPHHALFGGSGHGRGSGFEHGKHEGPHGGTEYLRGGEGHGDASPDHMGGADQMEKHHPSYSHEAREFGSEGLKDNLGSKRKSGYGNPQGGTTGEEHEGEVHDETRGTHELPKHPYAAKRAVPQEAREALARALLHVRR